MNELTMRVKATFATDCECRDSAIDIHKDGTLGSKVCLGLALLFSLLDQVVEMLLQIISHLARLRDSC